MPRAPEAASQHENAPARGQAPLLENLQQRGKKDAKAHAAYGFQSSCSEERKSLWKMHARPLPKGALCAQIMCATTEGLCTVLVHLRSPSGPPEAARLEGAQKESPSTAWRRKPRGWGR